VDEFLLMMRGQDRRWDSRNNQMDSGVICICDFVCSKHHLPLLFTIQRTYLHCVQFCQSKQAARNCIHTLVTEDFCFAIKALLLCWTLIVLLIV